MLSIILGFLVFCLAVWCFFALAASGLLQIIVFAASLMIGAGILAFANSGLLTSILGLAFIVFPFWLLSDYISDN